MNEPSGCYTLFLRIALWIILICVIICTVALFFGIWQGFVVTVIGLLVVFAFSGGVGIKNLLWFMLDKMD